MRWPAISCYGNPGGWGEHIQLTSGWGGGTILRKASSLMPFLKDEEGLACEREWKALQEEEHPMQRQSHGHE